ncbi:MAG: glycosyltransferase family 4 protein [Lachnospiraceae bacterium]|nr:glycosyltransferase family 4 protein [Lachnospiraceae bacterium]
MTPVLGKEKKGIEAAKGVYYVPFVVEPCLRNVDEKQYFLKGKIRILCVGKYEERKHHIELLKAIYELPCRNETEIIFVGECSRSLHEAYMMRLMDCAQKYGMEEQVQILSNMSLEEVYSEYKKADLFVLPSTGEFASISQLEAMSCALPVICSNTNGTADCVEEGINGFLFQDNNFSDLKKKLEFALNDRNALKNMGKASYEMVLKKYGFENYKKSILKILENAE